MAQMTTSAAEIVAIAAAALLILLMPLLSDVEAAAAATIPIGMPNCVTSCGGVKVPYPFGLGSDASCYLPGLNLTCDTSRPGDARLLLDTDGKLQVVMIPDDQNSYLNAQHSGDINIHFDDDGNGNGTFFSHALRPDGPYMLGSRNELVLTGCNVQVTVKDGNLTVAGCTSLCRFRVNYNNYDDDEAPPTLDDIIGSVASPCSGSNTGCCSAGIVAPEDYEGQVYTSGRYDVQLTWFGSNRSADLEVLPVRVFVAQKGWFDNSSVYTDLLQTRRPPSKDTMAVPIMLLWEAVGHSCSSVCKSNQSDCLDDTRSGGYLCLCKAGYVGNPYLIDGCKDTNECEQEQTDTGCYGECFNTEGSFTCRCPPGTTGNHSIPGGCMNTTVAATDRRLFDSWMVLARRRRFHQMGSFLMLCPCCCDIVSGAMVEHRRFVQEYTQTVVCAGDSWKMVHLVLDSWLEADGSGSLLRRRRAGVSVLKFDGVSGVVLPRSDSFSGNVLFYGKLFWRSEKLLISDGAASISAKR